MDENIVNILKKINPEYDFLNNNLNLISEGILDSFDIIRLVSELEDFYDISFNSDEIEANNFESINNIEDIVKRKIKDAKNR